MRDPIQSPNNMRAAAHKNGHGQCINMTRWRWMQAQDSMCYIQRYSKDISSVNRLWANHPIQQTRLPMLDITCKDQQQTDNNQVSRNLHAWHIYWKTSDIHVWTYEIQDGIQDSGSAHQRPENNAWPYTKSTQHERNSQWSPPPHSILTLWSPILN